MEQQQFIVIYHHRHGSDAWLSYNPDPRWHIARLEDWEPEREEYIEIYPATFADYEPKESRP